LAARFLTDSATVALALKFLSTSHFFTFYTSHLVLVVDSQNWELKPE